MLRKLAMEHLIAWLNEQRGRRLKLAAFLGITPGAVTQWEKVPAERMGDIACFTGIPMEELRGDIFASAAKPMPHGEAAA